MNTDGVVADHTRHCAGMQAGRINNVSGAHRLHRQHRRLGGLGRLDRLGRLGRPRRPSCDMRGLHCKSAVFFLYISHLSAQHNFNAISRSILRQCVDQIEGDHNTTAGHYQGRRQIRGQMRL